VLTEGPPPLPDGQHALLDHNQFDISSQSVHLQASQYVSHLPSVRFASFRNDAVERAARAAAAGVPQHLCPESLHHLRKRQLHAERYGNISAAQDPVYGTIASSTVQAVKSDRLEPLQLEQLRAVVAQYKDQISWHPDDIGKLKDRYKGYHMSIPTKEGVSCKQKPYRLSHREMTVYTEQLDMLLAQGVVKKASGPTDFYSPVLFVPKPRKPSELRMCIVYRRLNAVSQRDFHALPHIRDLLQAMSGCKYFTAWI
jgi:hypothetical protein